MRALPKSWHAFDFAVLKNMLHILLLIIFFYLSIIRRIPCNQIYYKTCLHHKRWLVWLVLLAQVWTHYKIGKFNMWALFCNVCINFLNNQIWKEIMLELNGKPSSVTTFSTDFCFQNLNFWNLFEFSAAEIT